MAVPWLEMNATDDHGEYVLLPVHAYSTVPTVLMGIAYRQATDEGPIFSVPPPFPGGRWLLYVESRLALRKRREKEEGGDLAWIVAST